MAEKDRVKAFCVVDPKNFIVDGSVPQMPVDIQEALAAYNALHPQERAFLRHLCENRLDGDTAFVFADWLEENGRDEAGRKVRLLRPQPGDTLVVWAFDTSAAGDVRAIDPDYQDELRKTFGVRHVLFIGQGQDVRLLSPEDMREAGWVRAEEADRRVSAVVMTHGRIGWREGLEAAARVAETLYPQTSGPGWLAAAQRAAVAQEVAAAIRARGEDRYDG